MFKTWKNKLTIYESHFNYAFLLPGTNGCQKSMRIWNFYRTCKFKKSSSVMWQKNKKKGGALPKKHPVVSSRPVPTLWSLYVSPRHTPEESLPLVNHFEKKKKLIRKLNRTYKRCKFLLNPDNPINPQTRVVVIRTSSILRTR